MDRTILLVADGASVHTHRLASAYVGAGWQVHLACFECSAIEGVTRHSLGSAPVTQDARYIYAIPKLARVIRKLTPDIVHAHYVTSYGVLARGALMLIMTNRPPLVISAWGSDLLVTSRSSRSMARLHGWALRGASLITGDSHDLRTRARELAPRTPWHTFVFGPERSLVSAPRRDAPLILSARTLIPEMRVDRVIEAFAVARVQAPGSMGPFELMIAGDGPEADRLRSIAAGLPVIFTGMLARPRLHQLMMQARVLISVPESDATSATLMDGLAAGMVPVVNGLEANSQWVDGAVGEIVSANPDIHELAGALVRSVDRPPGDPRIRQRIAGVIWEDQLERLLGRVADLVPDGSTNKLLTHEE